uniref:Uncharacterized protein n=1 Tax=Amphimedon queenslandica TaxID=400682 RepID=A0A1X7U9I6_AMPQE
MVRNVNSTKAKFSSLGISLIKRELCQPIQNISYLEDETSNYINRVKKIHGYGKSVREIHSPLIRVGSTTKRAF